MKKIGFIDIYDYKIKESLTTGCDFKYNLYIFGHTAHGYEFKEKVEDLSNAYLRDIEHFYMSLPAELLNFRLLEFPFKEREKLSKVIPYELGNLIFGGITDITYDFTVLESSENTTKILVAYIDKKIIKGILESFKSFGIDVYIITSLELGQILKEKKEDMASRLINPEALSGENRIKMAISEVKANTINLRTGEFAYTRDVEKSGRMVKLMLILLICLAIIINAHLGFKIITTKNEIGSLREQMRSIYSTIFPADKKITDELYQMKSHMKNLKEKAEIVIGVNPLDLMTNVAGIKPKGIIFEEINLDREVITMKGEAASMSDIDTMKRSLSESYYNVSVSDIKPLSETKILFTLIIKDKPL